jgi:tRNA threonylcarbamoyladenosine dehydratase
LADGSCYKLNEFGGGSLQTFTNKEDERNAALAARARKGDYDDGEMSPAQSFFKTYFSDKDLLDLILEQLARNRVFLTDGGLKKLRGSFVIVVGLGGVGSHATTALARSGVAKLRLIDFDQVTLSSLNRHAVATLADVGTPKVRCMRRRLEQITPWVRFDCCNELFRWDAAQKLLAEWNYELQDGEDKAKPDYVIDCIDNIDSKVALLLYCHQHDIRVVSSMGAGCKSDPSRICVGDISNSMEDPLSRSTRRRLKILGVSQGISVVFSTEKPGPGKAELVPLSEEEFAKGEVGDLGVLPDFRVRILPVLGTMPAMFGYAAANHVICAITGYPLEYRAGDKSREKMYEGILSTLQGMETRLVRSANGKAPVGLKIPLNSQDVAYLVEEVFRGKSVVSGLTTRLALVRWQKPRDGYRVETTLEKEGQIFVKLYPHELVCLTKEEAQRHEREILRGDKSPQDIYGPEVIRVVSKRQLEESSFSRFR